MTKYFYDLICKQFDLELLIRDLIRCWLQTIVEYNCKKALFAQAYSFVLIMGVWLLLPLSQ